MSIELEGVARPLTQKIVEEDEMLSRLFASIFPAIAFCTRRDQIPEPVQTEASLAALKVIDAFKQQQRRDAAGRIARRKL
jgi:hypothetical protein